MNSRPILPDFLVESARRCGGRRAILDPGRGEIAFAELDALSDRLRDRLWQLGVESGDRVGFCIHKSIDAVASIYGILKAGAVCVPLDPEAPSARNAYILHDCSVKAIILQDCFLNPLRIDLEALGENPPTIVLRGDEPLMAALDSPPEGRWLGPDAATQLRKASNDDIAYILYTSGSTGRPKGVMLSHENMVSFIDWSSEVFRPGPEDRFSSHAPLHFDLPILDVHLSMRHGATLILISEELGRDPLRLAQLIADEHISIWYSTPVVLRLLSQYGRMERYTYPDLRLVLFTGEVFPVKYLRALKKLLPHPRYYNLYGPLETNVSTYYEIPETVPEDRTLPFPIGKECSHLKTMVIDGQGRAVSPGSKGELCVHGPAVTRGYCNLPEQTARAFHVDAGGRRWYKTGDIVFEDEEGNYCFSGRRDRMIKKRGYRIELDEIEACLLEHRALSEVGVVALPDEKSGMEIIAYLGTAQVPPPTLGALKDFCADRLPKYMIPDRFIIRGNLPLTSTGKIAYQKLRNVDKGEAQIPPAVYSVG